VSAIGRELLGFIWAIAVRNGSEIYTLSKDRLTMPAISCSSFVAHHRPVQAVRFSFTPGKLNYGTELG
jgi:hypothetical protein